MHDETAARTWSRRAVLRAVRGAAIALPVLCSAGRVAAQTAPEPAFLRMLAAVPDRPEFVSSGVSFADVAAAKRLYGFADVRTLDDFRRVSDADYRNAIGGCYLTNETVNYSASGQFRDLFGYDLFAIEREIATGQRPDTITRVEGTFDAGEIAAKLRDGGYTTADHNGAGYEAVRGDYQIALTNPRSRVALAGLNRIAYDARRITTAGATATIAAALDAEAGRVPTLAANPAFRALALALGDVTSTATVDVGNGDTFTTTAVVSEAYGRYLREQVRDWNALRPASLVAMGYTDRGADNRVMHVARVYANPDDAAVDAPELERRIAGYTLVRTNRRLISEYATSVTARTETHKGAGVLLADVTLAPGPNAARLWLDMTLTRDALFLVPDPSRFAPRQSHLNRVSANTSAYLQLRLRIAGFLAPALALVREWSRTTSEKRARTLRTIGKCRWQREKVRP